MKTEGNEKAFFDAGDQCIYAYGLTKREYFAACALQNLKLPYWGEYSDGSWERGLPVDHCNRTARMAVLLADAMIDALNK